MENSEIITINNQKYEVIKALANKSGKKRKTSFWVGLFTLALGAVLFILGFVAIRLMFPPMCVPITIWTFVGLVGGYIAYLFVHALLRGLILAFSPRITPKDLLFGASFKAGAVFCISKVPVKIAHMRAVLLLPTLLITLPLLAYSIALGDVIILIGAALSLTVNAGGLWFLGVLRSHKGSDLLLEDKESQDNEAPSGYILKQVK